ncbi:MAG: type III pantothenate kinase [Flavobacteriaceae bacterium]|nr:type III pantothenate kinase [Flavobacteriaceae bacterium]
MNLVIDIGNTQVKTAVFKDHTLIDKATFSKDELYSGLKNISIKNKITHTILSSVGKLDALELEKLQNLFPCLILNSRTKLPFNNQYKTPHTLGVDRMALMAAAVDQYPDQNVLVIDAGSCLTYDFVSDQKNYFGGTISPGIAMRYKSLNDHTANLPKLSLVNKIPEKGDSTENAIHLGVINGVIFEIEGVINQYKALNQKLTVILTGGDTIFLAKNIKSTIFANPNFLLEGLNSILTYNLDE